MLKAHTLARAPGSTLLIQDSYLSINVLKSLPPLSPLSISISLFLSLSLSLSPCVRVPLFTQLLVDRTWPPLHLDDEELHWCHGQIAELCHEAAVRLYIVLL